MSDTTVVSALLAGLAAVSSALAWMTIGRFSDRKEFEQRLAQLVKEQVELQRSLLERSLMVQHEQARASDALAVTLREHAAADERVRVELDRLVDAVDDVLGRALHDVVKAQPLQRGPPRRTISAGTIAAVRDLLDDKDKNR